MRFFLAVYVRAFLYLSVCSALAYPDVDTYIPKNASDFLPTVRDEQARIFPDNPIPFYVPGLIEQESCVSLVHSKCWDPSSELKTAREQGTGWFQITRAFKNGGAIRFDTLADLRKKHLKELNELNWSNIKDRPDLQVIAGLYLIKENWDALSDVPDPYNRMAFADSAYNGGMTNLQKSRRVCAITRGCDHNVWFDNVENCLVQSSAALYGQRSAKDINQDHVNMALRVRLWKYRDHMY